MPRCPTMIALPGMLGKADLQRMGVGRPGNWGRRWGDSRPDGRAPTARIVHLEGH